MGKKSKGRMRKKKTTSPQELSAVDFPGEIATSRQGTEDVAGKIEINRVSLRGLDAELEWPPRWHSLHGDKKARMDVFNKIYGLALNWKGGPLSKVSLSELDVILQSIEIHLYQTAPSLEAYVDTSTLEGRVRLLVQSKAMEIKSSKKSRSLGHISEDDVVGWVKQVRGRMVMEIFPDAGLIEDVVTDMTDEFWDTFITSDPSRAFRVGSKAFETIVSFDSSYHVAEQTFVDRTFQTTLLQESNDTASTIIDMLLVLAVEGKISTVCFEAAMDDFIRTMLQKFVDKEKNPPSFSELEILGKLFAEFIRVESLNLDQTCKICVELNGSYNCVGTFILEMVTRFLMLQGMKKAAELLLDSTNIQSLIEVFGQQEIFWRMIHYPTGIFLSTDDCVKERPRALAWLRFIELLDGRRSGKCSFCGKEGDLYLCGGACYGAHAYCRQRCQRKHWKVEHHKYCHQLKVADAPTGISKGIQRVIEWKNKNKESFGEGH